ncbi:Trypsin-1 precursor [Labeo rohita]|uniref:Trypsin-1 n=1 Tax=Labeo rohita TaxID=84645 RepID=A0A498MIJ8_LABRO|nr:Trypsin-1 precursor [Labeo rohita]
MAFLKSSSHQCGGSLINKDWIVSAAHCYDSRIEVLLGKHNTAEDESSEQSILSERVIRHPQFNYYTIDNDIMLIKLSKPATLNEYVKPLDLPKSCAPPDTMCRVSGWGITMNDTVDSDKLQCLNLSIISDLDCNKSYPGLITASMFCAGYLEGGKGVCQGDSGGPLVCNGELQGGRSQSPSSVSQQQNSSQTSEQNQSETGNKTLMSDIVSGATDVTYVEIELKSTEKQKKKKDIKGKTSESSDTVYSKLNLVTHQASSRRSGSDGLNPVIVGVSAGLTLTFFITVFLVLLRRYRNNKGGRSQSPSTVSQQQNNSQTSEQNQSETRNKTLMSGTVHIYDSFNATINKDTGTEIVSGATELTYAEIELKSTETQKKKKENKEAIEIL